MEREVWPIATPTIVRKATVEQSGLPPVILCGVGNGGSLPDYDQQLQAISAAGNEVQRDVGNDSLVDRMAATVAPFLDQQRDRPGPIVIKTSTADTRPKSHEPDDRLLGSIFELVRLHFPTRELILADGPAFKANYHELAEQLGWTGLANKHDATIVDLNTEPAKPILGGTVSIASLCSEAAFTISIGKAKTHRRTGLSGAEKARIGYLSGAELGYPKLESRHYLLPAIYHAIEELAAPTLHIMDGINAIEGNGPMDGTPMDTEFVLVGQSPAAIDIELASLFGFDPALVISLFHTLPEPSPVTLITTDRSIESLRRSPARPPKQQPWLYKSLAKQGSRRNRRNFAKIRKAFAGVPQS